MVKQCQIVSRMIGFDRTDHFASICITFGPKSHILAYKQPYRSKTGKYYLFLPVFDVHGCLYTQFEWYDVAILAHK